MEEVLSEEEKGVIKAEEIRKAGALFSPEGVLMMTVAIGLDIFGLICLIFNIFFGLGEIPSWISDGIGIIFFGFWLLIRSQTLARERELVEKVMEKRMAIARIARTVKMGRILGRKLRFGIALLGEILPLIGALPFWTWFVYSELKS